MNKVILVGRLARDPEVKYTQTGKAVATFAIAVNRFGGGKDGQKDADFIPIVAWEKLAEISGNNLSKGQRVLIEGRMQVRQYETNDGQKRTIAEVIAQNIEFLEKRQGDSSPSKAPGDPNSFGADVFPEEDIPF